MKILNKYLPIITLAVLVIIGALLSDSFLTLNNILNMLQYSTELGLIALGMTFVILTGGIDLSVGSIVSITAVMTASFQSIGVIPILFLAVILGAFIGLLNGLIITKTKIEPFMATLAMMIIVKAASLWYTNGGPVLAGVAEEYRSLSGRALGIPLPIIYLIIAFIIGYIILNRTPFGRHVLAVGGGEETAKLFGVKVDRVKVFVYMLSGVLSALAGALITARIGMGEPRSGFEYEFFAIAMVIIGGTALMGGRGTIGGTFIGVIIFAVILNLMNLLNISTHIQPIIQGVVIISAALIISRKFTSKKAYETS